RRFCSHGARRRAFSFKVLRSFPRKREPRAACSNSSICCPWVPAFAGTNGGETVIQTDALARVERALDMPRHAPRRDQHGVEADILNARIRIGGEPGFGCRDDAAALALSH